LRPDRLYRDAIRRDGVPDAAFGVSTIGNTLGATGTVEGTLVLAGIGGITLSQSTNDAGATVSISGAAESGVGISAAGASAGTGLVVFSNANNVSFGMAGSTVTASASAAGVAISAGANSQNTGTVIFADSNGLSFGLAGGTLTASHNAVQSVGAQDFGGGAGLNVGVPRWVWASSAGYNVAFSKSVNGVSGSIFARAQAVAVADGAGTQTSGTVQFSNANGVSFGLAGGTMTASVSSAVGLAQISFWDGSALKHNNVQTVETTRLLFQRIHIAAPIAATRAQLMMHVSNSSSAGGTVAFSFAVYTMSGSTASLASSASRTWAYNSTLAGNSYTDIQLTNYRSMTLGTWSLSQGDYLFALQCRVTTALTAGTYQWLGGEDISIAGYDNGTGPVSYFNHGKLSVSTAAFPATVHPTDIKGANFSAAFFFPYFQLIGTL
jgi:hypothetical protein